MKTEKKQCFFDNAFDPYDLLGQGVKNGKKFQQQTSAAEEHSQKISERDDFL